MAYKGTLAALDTAGGVFSLLNPEGVTLIVESVVIDVTTKATGACTVDCGIATTSATDDSLIDGVDVGTAVITADSVINAGTNGKGARQWAAGSYLTVTKASGAAAGLVGSIYINYHVA